MIFLKVDSTVVKEVKDLVKSNNRRSSFKGQGSKEDSGMDMLKRLNRQENSHNSSTRYYTHSAQPRTALHTQQRGKEEPQPAEERRGKEQEQSWTDSAEH
eukprot:TRINITY_DN12794_c0_g1_i2.p3 TRINITY_DN12794_c0_g1~~TRINITY_DN12794_c0_g1_i2.p3  ORF type:complete len:100 (+),score=14.11 TRINITY_DN12794_c0_g1_i2:858-1157(+)